MNFSKINWKNCICVFGAMLPVCGIYLYRILNYTIGIDTEMAITNYSAENNWLIGCGRFSIVLLRSLLEPNGFDYYWSILLLIIIICLIYLVYACILLKSGLRIGAIICFELLFLTNPIFIELFYFTGLCWEFALGILCSIVATELLGKFILRKKGICYLLYGVAIGVFSLGVYQANLYLMVAEILFLLYRYVSDNENRIRSIIKVFVQFVLIGMIIVLLYFCVSDITINQYYVNEMDYAGWTNAQSYIWGQVYWRFVDWMTCIRYVLNGICNSFNHNNVFGNIWYLNIFALVIIIQLLNVIKYKTQKYTILLMLCVGIICSSYINIIFKGHNVSAREQFVLPYVISILVMILFQTIKCKWLRIFLIGIVCCMMLRNYTIDISLLETDKVRFEKDSQLAFELIERIEKECSEIEEKAIVFVGQKIWNYEEEMIQGEMIGGSFFQWDYGCPQGINYRVYNFMKCCDFNYRKPTLEEIKRGNELAIDLPIWPEAESLLIDSEIIVIRLS